MRDATIKISLLFLVLISLTSPAHARGWLYQNPYPTYRLTGVKFVSPHKGWVVGDYGTILYTEDGGNTWELQESGITDGLNGIFFFDEKRGWIVGNGGTILSTANGGKRWERQEVGSGYNLKKISFVDPKEGWILAEDTNRIHVIFHTKDSGKNWREEFF